MCTLEKFPVLEREIKRQCDNGYHRDMHKMPWVHKRDIMSAWHCFIFHSLPKIPVSFGEAMLNKTENAHHISIYNLKFKKTQLCIYKHKALYKTPRWKKLIWKLTPSGSALQHTALTNSFVSSSFRSLSRTLLTVSNLKVSKVLESPL